MTSLSLLLDLTSPWVSDVWESRLKALAALACAGSDTHGMEKPLLNVMRIWIEGAFSGLLSDLSPEERSARQRSVETMVDFLLSLLTRTEFVARVSEEDTNRVLGLFGGLVDSSLSKTVDQMEDHLSPLPSASSKTPTKHQRNPSSSSSSTPARPLQPVELAVEMYLKYLSIRLKAIAPDHLNTIVPYLFRALAYYSTPLPKLSLKDTSSHSNIVDLLDKIVSGPYSASCTLILKRHLLPSSSDVVTSMRTSLGALRTLRLSIRRALQTRMARVYISRATSDSYTPSGAPGHIDLGKDFIERAWAKDDVAVWNISRFLPMLTKAVQAWLSAPFDEVATGSSTLMTPETILSEIIGILLDLSECFDEVADSDEMDQEEVEAVGKILGELVVYLDVSSGNGSQIMLDLTRKEASSPFLATLSYLLSQDLKTTPLFSVLPPIILSIASHVTDTDTARVVRALADRQSLEPTTPAWLDHWKAILSVSGLYTQQRPLTRSAVSESLRSVWGFVRDIPSYRMPLATLVLQVWKREIKENGGDCISAIFWRILGDELVFRHNQDDEDMESILSTVVAIAIAPPSASPVVNDIPSTYYSPELPSTIASHNSGTGLPTASPVSPVLSRMQSDLQGFVYNAENSIPSVMSLLSSFTSTNTSRSQSRPPRTIEATLAPSPSNSTPRTPLVPTISKNMGAVSALVSTFAKLAFTGLSLSASHRQFAQHIFEILIEVITTADSPQAKITALQFLMRLRVDRDHRLYYASSSYDENGHVHTLAAQISRVEGRNVSTDLRNEAEARKPRSRIPQERNGRKMSRGPTARHSPSGSSRSRSRATSKVYPMPTIKAVDPEPLWKLPDTLPFTISAEADTPSDGLISFDPAQPEDRLVLPFSKYLTALLHIITEESSWEVLSYVLCHLPTQLSNKHLFCGPKSRVVIGTLLHTLCNHILENRPFGSEIAWPEGVVSRDAHGLAYATLTVLISHKRCFPEAQPQHRLVEVFLVGLNAQPSTIKCSLHALSLSAFELKKSTTKFLPRILEKLSQIMSNPVMAVHIIDFLTIVGSLPALHSNFTEGDYKMVFGVALQYLQHYNRADGAMANVSWALSQHVRIMAYYIVYSWFLAMPLPDRPRHVKFIARQLLLANESKGEVDEPAEVCFDWLARYTYASADPRPANSMLNEIVMNPTRGQVSQKNVTSEKTWITGNSVVTIRTLERRGWVEVITRRPSGLTKFICRAENVPLVTTGDVDPDIPALPAALTLERSPSNMTSEDTEGSDNSPIGNADSIDNLDTPNPITGYVWSGTAPSQRRKEVSLDPSYFALQLSTYPDTQRITDDRFLVEPTRLPAFFRTLDRMPVIDTHKVGILYVAPGQTSEAEILNNTHGSPAYTRFLEGLGRLINLRGQLDVYAGGLDPDEDGEYAYAWWDDIGQVLYHTATLMPSDDLQHATNKKRHIGNDFVRIIWNDSGAPYKFGTLSTQFQFVNIVIEPHSRGAIAAFSNNVHENEYFKVTLQRAPGMTEFTPIGDFKLISAENLPLLVRQLSLLTDWFVSVFQETQQDTVHVEMTTNWRSRLQTIKRFRSQVVVPRNNETSEGVVGQESYRDFTNTY
ncbi:hypothetical protein QCA50_007969 [Cerrena zonata]|uniref:Rap-GAP domain-containing protein n=1 Tax=Cerrena zonata TaxID=2478898 RepID=A0AAW0G519_9APHY